MRLRHRNSTQRGFTLFELLIVITVMGIMATIATPNFLRLLQRSKLTGFAQQTSVLMRTARQFSIRHNTPTIVWVDQANDQLVAWVDVDGVNLGDPADWIFNPVPGQPHRSTDFEIARYTLPSRVEFLAPGADPYVPSGLPVWQFTTVGAEQVAVFLPNGSVEERGAIRLADAFGNFLQIRVEPRATGRVRVEKFNDTDIKWYVRNETGKPWEWK